ncbi:MAG: hypothetical protein J6X33_03340 [Clostridiales bacterium]|nr:hypothetical protein [Clostridiales bacterium]
MAENTTTPEVKKVKKNDLNAMSDHDLLVELVKSQQKTETKTNILALILMIFVLLITLALCIIIPKVVFMIDSVNNTIIQFDQAVSDFSGGVTEIETALSEAQGSLDGIDEMVGNVNKIVVENTDNASNAIENLSSVDIDTLNQSIKSLHDIVEPLANFFNKLPH